MGTPSDTRHPTSDVNSAAAHARECGQLAGPGLGHPRTRDPHRATCQRQTGARRPLDQSVGRRERAGVCERTRLLLLLPGQSIPGPIHQNGGWPCSHPRAPDRPRRPRAHSIDRARDAARSSANGTAGPVGRGIMGGPPILALRPRIIPPPGTLPGGVPGSDWIGLDWTGRDGTGRDGTGRAAPAGSAWWQPNPQLGRKWTWTWTWTWK